MTKIMIDRDLLERIGELMHIIAHRQDDYGVEAEYLGSLLTKAIAQPNQQGEVLTQHSGCGRGIQVDQLTVRMYPGDKVVMVRGRIGKALAASTAKQGEGEKP